MSDAKELELKKFKIKLKGEDFNLLPSFTALELIETETGVSCLSLLQDFAANKAKVTNCVKIIYSGILAYEMKKGRFQAPFKKAEIGEMILDSGLPEAITLSSNFLSRAMVRDPHADKYPEEQAEKKSE